MEAVRGGQDHHPELLIDPDAVTSTRPLHAQPVALLVVYLGGALGTWSRYELTHVTVLDNGPWPTATFTANLVGAFILGVLLEILARSGEDRGIRRRLRLLLGTGFCGGLTTYSTFAVETDLLVRADRPLLAAGYALATVTAGLALTAVGIAVAGQMRPDPNPQPQ